MPGEDDPTAPQPPQPPAPPARDAGDLTHPATLHTRRSLRAHRNRRHPTLRRIGWVAAGLVVVMVGLTAFAWFKLNANITRVDVSKMLGTRPSDPGGGGSTGPLNILILGSDTRKNIGTTQFGTDTEEGGAHSDTNLLVHLSADRDWATVVSIPRDSMVPGPVDCSPTAPVSEWEVRQWNYNFHYGGPGCTIRALEGNTGIFVDHYAVINFAGFRDMVDALGGIEVCTNEAINDPESGLTLTPGRHTLNGKDALGYVRVRKTITGGSDISRIKRQQAFMSSVIQKATATSMLARPDKLYSFLDAATKALTTDPAFDGSAMRDIALSLRKIEMNRIDFVTVPIEEYPPDPNRVQWTSNADLIWRSIKKDRPLRTPAASPSASPESSPSVSQAPLTVAPNQVAGIQVLNASGVAGLASQAVAALQVQGFGNLQAADAPLEQGATVAYSSGFKEAARTVAAAFPGAKLVQVDGLGDQVRVTLGLDSPAVVEVPNRLGTEPLPTPTIQATPNPSGDSWSDITPRSADTDICS